MRRKSNHIMLLKRTITCYFHFCKILYEYFRIYRTKFLAICLLWYSGGLETVHLYHDSNQSYGGLVVIQKSWFFCVPDSIFFLYGELFFKSKYQKTASGYKPKVRNFYSLSKKNILNLKTWIFSAQLVYLRRPNLFWSTKL